MTAMALNAGDGVGPVLESGPVGEAIVAAIRATNPGVVVVDRGSYLRVLVPGRCELSRLAVEERLGRPFRLPGDLERAMPSFKGRLAIGEDGATWTLATE